MVPLPQARGAEAVKHDHGGPDFAAPHVELEVVEFEDLRAQPLAGEFTPKHRFAGLNGGKAKQGEGQGAEAGQREATMVCWGFAGWKVGHRDRWSASIEARMKLRRSALGCWARRL